MPQESPGDENVRRLQLSDDDRGDAQTAPSTLSEVAYQRLREDIIFGVFKPGQPLRLENLKQRYNLSFSPLREALNRLQTERLVGTAPLRGFSVAPVSIEEMRDATETRILIECEALRRSMIHGDDDWEGRIVAAFHALDLQVRRSAADKTSYTGDGPSSLEKRHQDFHRALIDKCQSRRLIDLADQLYAETQRYRLPTLIARADTAGRNVADEHRQIMEATLARRTDEALTLLAAHYRRTADTIESDIFTDQPTA